MEQLKPLIEQLVKMIQEGTDFVKGQIPDVAQQILAYSLWHNVVIFSALLFLVGVLLYVNYRAFRWMKASDEYDAIPALLIADIVGVFLLAGLLDAIENILMIHFAPKIFLLQYLKEFLK